MLFKHLEIQLSHLLSQDKNKWLAEYMQKLSSIDKSPQPSAWQVGVEVIVVGIATNSQSVLLCRPCVQQSTCISF